ncbi:MAG TPA: SgcJ/EcaC family oxidoreductase [Kofleriaceae bacterium]|nr:SgcJ/EcaC family oxidoreductase [Kofleriaceae bacterium]
MTRPTPRPERATIAGVIAALTDAWNRHDLVAMGELYRADADFVNIFGGYLRGRDEIVREHTERHKVMFATARMASTAPAIRSLTPTLALARVAWTMRGIAGPDGKPAPDREGLLLHVLARAGGEWSIITSQNTELAREAPRRFLDLLAAS